MSLLTVYRTFFSGGISGLWSSTYSGPVVDNYLHSSLYVGDLLSVSCCFPLGPNPSIHFVIN